MDFLVYDTYLNGLPIEHLDIDWDIPSIYLFPAKRKTSERFALKYDLSYYHKATQLFDFLLPNLDIPIPHSKLSRLHLSLKSNQPYIQPEA